MAGLVGYASSDEESDAEQKTPPQQPQPSSKQPAISNKTQATAPETAAQPPPSQDTPQPTPAQPAPLRSGPVGPSLPPMATTAPAPQPQDQETLPLDEDDGVNAAPSSPYSTTRSLLHDLTLPSIPNFDIPPSPPPPGSPSSSSGAAAAATNKKFEQFLQLKKKGTHFNAKLEQSAAIRNPALTDKLLAFVDVGAGKGGSAGRQPDARAVQEQYTTTLPADVWDPTAFPDWAFRDRLRRTREMVAKEREAARSGPGRSAVEFVAASGGAASSSESPGSGVRGEKRKSDWR